MMKRRAAMVFLMIVAISAWAASGLASGTIAVTVTTAVPVAVLPKESTTR